MIEPVSAKFLRDEDFIEACLEATDHLVYFILNVGDGDTQLLLLPAREDETRRAIVVDVADAFKLGKLVETLADAKIVKKVPNLFPIVIGTHPHSDHIRGMASFIDRFGGLVSEYWDPGYYHPTATYVETMRALEDRSTKIQYTQPTSGMTRFIDRVKITVLAPGMGLKSRFDSYGTEINDSSLALKFDFPMARIVQVDNNRKYTRLRDPWSIILGADAQTTSWAQATLDFPQLHARHDSALFKILRVAMGADAMKAHIFKVPHHGSKHGLNLELVERISPTYAVISSSAGSGRYGFPHALAVEALREAANPVAASGGSRPDDTELGIHYTGGTYGKGKPLGSIAFVISPKRGSPIRMFRFGDGSEDEVDLTASRLFLKPRS